MLYYNSETNVGKQTLAYVQSLAKHIQAVELSKNPFTGRMWKELLEMLNLRPKDLLDRSHPLYQEKVKGNMFEDEDWLNVLIKNPELIKAPIVVKGDKAILANTPSDVLKLMD